MGARSFTIMDLPLRHEASETAEPGGDCQRGADGSGAKWARHEHGTRCANLNLTDPLPPSASFRVKEWNLLPDRGGRGFHSLNLPRLSGSLVRLRLREMMLVGLTGCVILPARAL